MISQTTEYALRAIVFLADSPTEAHTAEAIAEGTKVPVGYLSKIMQGLAKAGLVSSQRGLYGGFTLIKSPRSSPSMPWSRRWIRSCASPNARSVSKGMAPISAPCIAASTTPCSRSRPRSRSSPSITCSISPRHPARCAHSRAMPNARSARRDQPLTARSESPSARLPEIGRRRRCAPAAICSSANTTAGSRMLSSL